MKAPHPSAPDASQEPTKDHTHPEARHAPQVSTTSITPEEPDESADPDELVDSDERDDLPSPPDPSADRLPLHARTAWAWLEIVIEVKGSTRRAPFSFGPHVKFGTFLPHGDAHVLSRGQSLQYCLQVLHRQHRLFVFTISICGNGYARFVRLDHSSALVSAQFNYIKHPEIIGTFLYRLSKLDLAGRGYDPTTTLASKDEVAKFMAMKSRYESPYFIVKSLNRAATEGWPFYKLTVDDCTGPSQLVERDTPQDPLPLRGSREYVVCRPMYASSSIAGRATKGFVALDLIEGIAVFIKDTWRPGEPTVRTEKSIYEHLWAEPSREMHIPTLLGGGDVGLPNAPQRTIIPEGVSILPRIHTRLVFKEVCASLEDFRSPRELVGALAGALRAHRWAWEKRKILHRDVSVGNILIYENPDNPEGSMRGLLCDWELAKTEAQIRNPRATQASRSGTWQFMSAILLWFPHKNHQLSDDLESFMHVLTWCTMMYLPHNTSYSQVALASVMFNFFDSTTGDNRGSHHKFITVRGGYSPISGLPPHHPLTVLLETLAGLCKDHYDTPGMIDELERTPQYGIRSNVEKDMDDLGPPTIYASSDEEGSKVQYKSKRRPLTARTRAVFASPLADHAEIFAAFQTALNANRLWLPLTKHPKTRRALVYTPLASAQSSKRTADGIVSVTGNNKKRVREDTPGTTVPGMNQLAISTPNDDVFNADS
ncbi:hypothetical protein C8Q79DRAFT_914438 [Trametes meyenii]|nr:hypothetical protein C8Q79DRAFT_914438 [Trametes meyenii]